MTHEEIRALRMWISQHGLKKINEKGKDIILEVLADADRIYADGCDGCKYQSKDEYEMPCLHCARGNNDRWTAEDESR